MYPMDPKAKLPPPYNQDLSPVLQGLARSTPQGRWRLANDPVTAAYLAAGVRLVERHLRPRTKISPNDEPVAERPLLKLLSQRAVADEVANNPPPFVRVGTTSTLRATWRSQSDYISDVLRFGLWSRHYEKLYAEELATRAEDLIDADDFVEAVHLAAYAHHASGLADARFRLQLVAAATADSDTVISRAMSDNYKAIKWTWLPVFADMLRVRGLRLRPGLTLDHMIDLIAAGVEGMTLRVLADPDAAVLDEQKQVSLAGTFALAFLASCTKPIDDPDERTLEQVVGDMVSVGTLRPGQ